MLPTRPSHRAFHVPARDPAGLRRCRSDSAAPCAGSSCLPGNDGMGDGAGRIRPSSSRVGFSSFQVGAASAAWVPRRMHGANAELPMEGDQRFGRHSDPGRHDASALFASDHQAARLRGIGGADPRAVSTRRDLWRNSARQAALKRVARRPAPCGVGGKQITMKSMKHTKADTLRVLHVLRGSCFRS